MPIGSAIRALRAEMQGYADNLARDHQKIREAALGEQKVIAMLLDTMKAQTEEAAKREQANRQLREENLRLMLHSGYTAETEREGETRSFP